MATFELQKTRLVIEQKSNKINRRTPSGASFFVDRLSHAQDYNGTFLMMIEFECDNFSNFDAGAGHYVACGHKLIVHDEKIGTVVTCPKCKQEVEVPFEPQAELSKSKVEKSAPAIDSLAAKRSTSQRPATPNRPNPSSQQRPKPTAETDDGELKLSSPIERPKADLPMRSISADEDPRSNRIRTASGGTSGPRVLQRDRRKRCHLCGNILDQKDFCKSCGQAETKFGSATQPLDDIKVQLAGFQLWFCTTMAEGVSMRWLGYGAHLAVVVLSLLFSSLAIFGVGGILGFLMFAFIGFCVAIYIAWVVKSHQLASNPRARLAWFQRPFWNAILSMARRCNWQAYDKRFEGRTIIDCRGEGITDNKLMYLDDLQLCEVLDLENTPISDDGLRYLYDLKNLHCVVVRKTSVTDEGVFRLQQARPRLWIWD